MATRIRPALLAALALVVAACASGAPSPASPGPSPSPGPDDAAFLLRATSTQALPPLALFAWGPSLLITADRRAITTGPVPAIYPGPLVVPLLERPISEAGWRTIVDAARAAGLLTGQADFSGGALMPGGIAARLEIVVDGVRYDLVGDPSQLVRCGEGIGCPDPAPGTAAAFAAFWMRLTDLGGWLAGEIGPETAHEPSAYALLVGPPPAEAPPLDQPPATWPLATPLADLGRPVRGEPSLRCGIVSGVDAAALRPLVDAASQLTPWLDPAAPGREHGLTARVLLPGDEDPCAGLVEG
jgi:hypothetical protein